MVYVVVAVFVTLRHTSPLMIILGIETSCDETAAAVVQSSSNKQSVRLLSNTIATQIDIHVAYGGVVPEVAARSHLEVMLPVINQSLEKAFPDEGDPWDKIDAIGVTHGPGLLGSLLMGSLTARTLALTKGKPLYGVDHVLGHVYANFIAPEDADDRWEPPQFPLLALIVSGGHTQLVLFRSHFDYTLLGQTLDDATGEAYDKVAKILGLPYPGGPSIQKRQPDGNPAAFEFPHPKTQNPYDFSFSGLKTAVLRRVQSECGKDYTFPSFKLAELLSESQVNDFCASFGRTAVDIIVNKTVRAFEEFQPKSVVIGGGVAANPFLRAELKARLPIEIEYAPMKLCTDNAAMIASLTHFRSLHSEPADPYALEIDPSLHM